MNAPSMTIAGRKTSTAATIRQKMVKLGQLYQAQQRAIAAQVIERDEGSALELQDITQQIQTLRATLPAIRSAT